MPIEIKIQLHQVSASTSEAAIRNHKVLVDRPAAKGGSDKGPMGGELFLAGLGGCFMSNVLAAAKAREADVSDVRIDVTGALAEAPARFETVDLFVTAESVDRDLLERLVEIAGRGCIMMNTLRDKLDVRIRVGAPV
jgi:putative redox protein